MTRKILYRAIYFFKRRLAEQGSECPCWNKRNQPCRFASFGLDCLWVCIGNITAKKLLDMTIHDHLLHDNNTTLKAKGCVFMNLWTPQFEVIEINSRHTFRRNTFECSLDPLLCCFI